MILRLWKTPREQQLLQQELLDLSMGSILWVMDAEYS